MFCISMRLVTRSPIPATPEPVITNLECALIESSETLRTVEGTRFREIYGAAEIRETYRCSYGINPDIFRVWFRVDYVSACWAPRARHAPLNFQLIRSLSEAVSAREISAAR